jgi:hypothetical protein
LLCPHCGVRTSDAEGAVPPATADTGLDDLPANGLIIGLLLAQGLYYALRHLVDAWLLAHGGVAAIEAYWDGPLTGLITQQALGATALFAGGMVAAAGRRHGAVLGAALGVLNAALLLGLHLLFRRSSDEATWYGQPLLNVFVGTVGGAVGSRIWQPAPELPPLTGDGRNAQEALTTVLPDRPARVVRQPVPWLRILIGIGAAIAGTLGARLIRDLVIVVGGGTGREMQSQFITWEIALVAQVMGGAIAGAVTRGGAAYGFWVGLPTAAFLIAAQSAWDVPMPGQEVRAWLLGAAVPDGSPAAVLIQGVQVLLMATLGGWLGSLALPANPGQRPTAGR